MTRRILIVGPSGSGKSTVAAELARTLGLPVISMDAFRRKGTRLQFFVEHRGKRIRNYEDPLMWDQNSIACKLRACIQAGSGFVAEGNHLLMYPQVRAICDAHPAIERWYVDVPFKVSLERRKTRHRFLPADESFALIGEEQTAIQVVPQKLIPGVRVIDGTRLPIEVFAAIVEPVTA